VSTDGSKLLYTCLKTSASSGPVPCGGSGPSVWYLLDAGADTRIRLDAFTGGLSISPDGRILLGETRGGIVLASTAAPGEVQRVDLPAGVHLGHPVWSPDSAHVVLGGGLYLLRVADARTTRLPLAGAAIAWTRDGSRFALAATGWNTGPSPLTVLDANGRVVWSREVLTAFPNPRWSADGSMLSVDVFETVPTPEQPAAERVDVFDGETGAAVVRIRGALACSGPVWAGDSHRLILGAYDTPAMPLVDLSDGTVRWLRGYVIPTPYSSDAGIALVQGGIDSVDLSTGKMTPLARLGEIPSFDAFGGEMFLGDKIAFTFPVLGHDGCGIAEAPAKPPSFAVLRAPFIDDQGASHPQSTAAAAASCGASAKPSDASGAGMLVNADGDGTPDRLLTRETASEPNRTAELELVLDSQRVVDVPLPLMNVDVAPIGGYDVDGDGRDELFVNTGQGAYTQYIDVYEFDPESCMLVRLAGSAPATAGAPAIPVTPPQFLVGASAQNGAGLACAGGLLARIDTAPPRPDVAPPPFEERRTSFAIEGDVLRFVAQDNYEENQVSREPAFDCGGLRPPAFAH
jgi:hypothetical protein